MLRWQVGLALLAIAMWTIALLIENQLRGLALLGIALLGIALLMVNQLRGLARLVVEKNL